MTNGRSRRREASVSFTEAENDFGEILAQVSRGDRVFITRDEKREAVVLSIDEYDDLVGAKPVDLEALEREFDDMFERMQEPRQRAAVDALFRMGSEDLGKAFAEEASRKNRPNS